MTSAKSAALPRSAAECFLTLHMEAGSTPLGDGACPTATTAIRNDPVPAERLLAQPGVLLGRSAELSPTVRHRLGRWKGRQPLVHSCCPHGAPAAMNRRTLVAAHSRKRLVADITAGVRQFRRRRCEPNPKFCCCMCARWSRPPAMAPQRTGANAAGRLAADGAAHARFAPPSPPTHRVGLSPRRRRQSSPACFGQRVRRLWRVALPAPRRRRLNTPPPRFAPLRRQRPRSADGASGPAPMTADTSTPSEAWPASVPPTPPNVARVPGRAHTHGPLRGMLWRLRSSPLGAALLHRNNGLASPPPPRITTRGGR